MVSLEFQANRERSRERNDGIVYFLSSSSSSLTFSLHFYGLFSTPLFSLILFFHSLLFSCPVDLFIDFILLLYLAPACISTTPSWDRHETILHSADLHITCIVS